MLKKFVCFALAVVGFVWTRLSLVLAAIVFRLTLQLGIPWRVVRKPRPRGSLPRTESSQASAEGSRLT